jgi:oligoribonuclease NrnB/cAMP/cGMP phosphodiesterase (DHH superfamily)
MNVKLFTHTDLDGIGCAIVGKIAYPTSINITYCNYDDVNQKIGDFVNNKEYLNFDYIYITDISVNKEIAELITNTHPENFKDGFNLGEMVQLLDHHQTAEWLNEYFWAKVTVDQNDEKTSGTRMFYNHIFHDEFISCGTNLFLFVETVRKYDTWLWKTKYNDETPKLWNDLLFIMGRDNFIEETISKIRDQNVICLNEFDNKILRYRQNDIDTYVSLKEKQLIQYTILEHTCGVVFAEQFHSELGNRLSESNPDLEFIVIINPSVSVSYRTVNNNINLGTEIAKIYGGGGHPKAAGSPISDEIKNKFIDMLFSL